MIRLGEGSGVVVAEEGVGASCTTDCDWLPVQTVLIRAGVSISIVPHQGKQAIVLSQWRCIRKDQFGEVSEGIVCPKVEGWYHQCHIPLICGCRGL